MAKSTSQSQNPLIRLLTNYSLSVALLLLFLISWAGQLVTQMIEFRDDARAHGESFALGDFFPPFFNATFETGDPSSCNC